VVSTGIAACSSPSTGGSGGSAAILPGSTSTTTAATGGTFTVQGRRLYLECHGSGSPTILLQSGYGNGGDIWNATTGQPPTVVQGLASANRVCVYDRPGSTLQVDPNGTPLPTPQPGRSEAVPQPRTSTALVTEWHDLLAAANVPSPYVLVGHSIGGLFALLYARTYPDQVAGLVTVDATPPALVGLLKPSTAAFLRSSLMAQSPVTGYLFEQYDLDEVLGSLAAAPALRAMPSTLMFAGRLQEVSDPAGQAFVDRKSVV